MSIPKIFETVKRGVEVRKCEAKKRITKSVKVRLGKEAFEHIVKYCEKEDRTPEEYIRHLVKNDIREKRACIFYEALAKGLDVKEVVAANRRLDERAIELSKIR